MLDPRLGEALVLDPERVGHVAVEGLAVLLRPHDERVPQVEHDGLVLLHFLRSFFSCGQRTGVEHLILGQPRAPGLADPDLDVVERGDLVRVARDRDLQAGLGRGAGMRVAQVEPVRLRVDLEEGAGAERGLDDAPEVEVRRRPPVDLAAGRMPDRVDVGALHRRDDPFGHVAAERGMDRGDDPVARGEQLVRHVERAVGADVDLDPLEHGEGCEPLVERVDLLPLRFQLAVAQVVGVIGEDEVPIALGDAGAGHLLDRVLPVGRPGRMRMEVTAEVAQLDQLGQLARPARPPARPRSRAAPAG